MFIHRKCLKFHEGKANQIFFEIFPWEKIINYNQSFFSRYLNFYFIHPMLEKAAKKWLIYRQRIFVLFY